METNAVYFFKNQEIKPLPKKQKIILAVWEIVNPENLGRIIRLGHNLGAEKVLFIQHEPKFRPSKIKKTAGFSFEQMNWAFISESDFELLLNSEYKLIVLETCDDSKNIYFEKLPDKIILLAGSESHGIPSKQIKKSDQKIFIPMPGDCKSLNITHALSIAAFEWYRQKSTK